MADSSASTGHSSIILRNIIVGVATTVLGSSAIYFLGFNRKTGGSSGNDYLVVKDATITAWKSYVTSENIYTKNSLSLMKELGETKKLDDFEENILAESKKFMGDLEQLIKNEKIDGDFISMMKRRLQNENTVLPKMKTYLGNIRSIINGNEDQNEKTQKLTAEDNAWVTYSKGVSERSVTDIEDLAKTLSEKYAQPFAMTDLLIYKMIKGEGTNTKPTNDGNIKDPKPENSDNPINSQNSQPVNPDANNVSRVNDPVNNEYSDPNNNKNRSNSNNTQIINKSMLTGDWSTTGAEIYLSQDGTMEWEVLTNGDNANGTWNFYNNQLYMYATNARTGQKTTWVFNLSNVTGKSFTMTLSMSPYNMYTLVRMKDY